MIWIFMMVAAFVKKDISQLPNLLIALHKK